MWRLVSRFFSLFFFFFSRCSVINPCVSKLWRELRSNLVNISNANKMKYILFCLGFLLFKEYCSSLSDEPVPQLKFYEEVCFFPSNEKKSTLFDLDQTIWKTRNWRRTMACGKRNLRSIYHERTSVQFPCKCSLIVELIGRWMCLTLFRLIPKKRWKVWKNIYRNTIQTIRKIVYHRIYSNLIRKKYVIFYVDESSRNLSNQKNTLDFVNGKISN